MDDGVSDKSACIANELQGRDSVTNVVGRYIELQAQRLEGFLIKISHHII